MGEFNLFDGIAVFIILLSAYLAYIRGVVREVMSVASWIVAAVLAYLLAPHFTTTITQLPLFGKYLSGSCELSIIVSFTLVFAIALVLCSFITSLLVRLTSLPGVGIINKGLGLIFGVLRGMIIVAVVLLIHDAALSESQLFPAFTESWSANAFHDLQMQIKELLPSNASKNLEIIYSNVTATCSSIEVPTIENPLPVSAPVEPQTTGS